MKLSKHVLFPLAVASLLALITTGCSSYAGEGDYRYRGGHTNIAGLVEIQNDSFDEVDLNTVDLYTTDIVPRYNPSGDKITLFWDLVTIADYSDY
jgi:hypothetical protein